MTKPLSVSEARDKLAEVIGQVQYGGERVTISRRGKPVAVVVSVADAAWLEAMEDQIDVKLALEAKAEMEALGGRPIPMRRSLPNWTIQTRGIEAWPIGSTMRRRRARPSAQSGT